VEKGTARFMTQYSVVIPIYNEQDNIEPLISELEAAMNAYKDAWELIFVDDGSPDDSGLILKRLMLEKPFLRTLRFKNNAGQTAALQAGFKAAKGDYVITLDGDGQNDPKDIPHLLAIAKLGYDLVAGKRRHRQDSQIKRIISKCANLVRQKILADGVSDTGCSLKVYRKSALDKIPLYKGMHRFLPALFLIEGFSVREVEVEHRPRVAGRSKYTIFNRGLSLAFDLLAVWWMKKRKLTYEVESP
jgi:dolichol-phosphate mannosyltransferase